MTRAPTLALAGQTTVVDRILNRGAHALEELNGCNWARERRRPHARSAKGKAQVEFLNIVGV